MRNVIDTLEVHLSAIALFILIDVLGYVYAGGLSFVQGWGGGIAAGIATFFLIFKSQGYWAWMIVNASLWTYLFFHVGLPMLAYLQISFLIFAGYGFVQWSLHKTRIGVNFAFRADLFGSVLALGLFIVSIIIYWNQPGYRGTTWWWLEFGSVITAIAAMWMDAFRYKVNWVMWTLSNCCSAPLFFHGKLWGPLWTIIPYQTLNFIGYYIWWKEEHALSMSYTNREEAPLSGPTPAGVAR